MVVIAMNGWVQRIGIKRSKKLKPQLINTSETIKEKCVHLLLMIIQFNTNIKYINI